MNKPHCTTKTNISWKMFLICFLPSIFLGLQQSNAATYYVSTGGSDGNDGSSVSSPVRTIAATLLILIRKLEITSSLETAMEFLEAVESPFRITLGLQGRLQRLRHRMFWKIPKWQGLAEPAHAP